MTTKTTKYSIIAAIAVTAVVLMGASVSASEAEVTTDIAVASGSKYDTNKQAGLPYIDKNIVTSDLSMKASNHVTMELTLMNAPAEAYVVLEPIKSDGGFVTDSTLSKEEVFERAQLASEGNIVTGIVQEKDILVFNSERIILKAGQPVQFDVRIDLTDSLRAQNPHSLVFNVGFQQVENVGVDTLPIKTGGITLEGPRYEQ